jgi:hypothetical protein
MNAEKSPRGSGSNGWQQFGAVLLLVLLGALPIVARVMLALT